MQISGITNCYKPRSISFASEESSKNGKRPRFKHYEEISDDALKLRSVIKAHEEVQNGGKMRVLKALPAITAGLIGTSIALTQPGKLSAKAATGLGFLATVGVASKATDVIFDNINDKANAKGEHAEVTVAKKLAALVATTIGAVYGIKGVSKYAPKLLNEHAKPLVDFVKKDIEKLTKEVNGSKIGTFVEEKLNPFIEKHQKGVSVASLAAPFAAVGGAFAAQGALLKGLSKDMKQKTEENYIKGKVIQAVARSEFEKIDAVEV